MYYVIVCTCTVHVCTVCVCVCVCVQVAVAGMAVLVVMAGRMKDKFRLYIPTGQNLIITVCCMYTDPASMLYVHRAS